MPALHPRTPHHHTSEYEIARLRASQYKFRMEQYLSQNEFELAMESVGQTIRYYSETEDVTSRTWAITKRKEISAIIAETEGRFEDAANLHENISAEGELKDGALRWHEHRADICRAKHQALASDYEGAREQIARIQDRSNTLKAESKDLAIVLSAAIAYRNGKQTDFRDSFEQLTPQDEIKAEDRPLSLEYNYENSLAVIHAAQRLSHANVDKEVLDMVVEISLREAFMPLKAGNTAASVGLDDISIQDQWQMGLPTPVAKRIAQIKLDENVPTTNYTGFGTRIIGTLEIYLAAYAEFYGRREWGSEWRHKLIAGDADKKLALGDLSNLFVTDATADLACRDQTHSLLTTELLGRDSVVTVRNDLSHEHMDNLLREEYEQIRDRVFEILQTSVDEAPVIGEVQNEYPAMGAYTVQLFWWRSQRHLLIQTDVELKPGAVYYLLRDSIETGDEITIVELNESKIIPVETDRILSNIGHVQ